MLSICAWSSSAPCTARDRCKGGVNNRRGTAIRYSNAQLHNCAIARAHVRTHEHLDGGACIHPRPGLNACYSTRRALVPQGAQTLHRACPGNGVAGSGGCTEENDPAASQKPADESRHCCIACSRPFAAQSSPSSMFFFFANRPKPSLLRIFRFTDVRTAATAFSTPVQSVPLQLSSSCPRVASRRTAVPGPGRRP